MRLRVRRQIHGIQVARSGHFLRTLHIAGPLRFRFGTVRATCIALAFHKTPPARVNMILRLCYSRQGWPASEPRIGGDGGRLASVIRSLSCKHTGIPRGRRDSFWSLMSRAATQSLPRRWQLRGHSRTIDGWNSKGPDTLTWSYFRGPPSLRFTFPKVHVCWKVSA